MSLRAILVSLPWPGSSIQGVIRGVYLYREDANLAAERDTDGMDIHSPYKRRKKMCGDFCRGYLLLASRFRKLAIYLCTGISLLCLWTYIASDPEEENTQGF